MNIDRAASFAGKRVTLMGLGLLGRGVGDAAFFAESGAELIVTDLKSEKDLAPSIARLKEFKNITYHLGGHRMEDFEDRDLVMRAPNAPLDSPFIAHAREHGIPVEMDASLFAKLSSSMIIGITGTRGKSTTTHMIYEILKADGRSVYLGGNERDIATLPLLKTTGVGDIIVLELDSWQLQGFANDRISPHIAVWTNFMPDHMNYYRGDMERYFEDKASIVRFQKEGDCFVTTSAIKERAEARFGKFAGVCMTDVALPEGWALALPGAHNRANAAYAYAATRALGVPEETVRKTLAAFAGLPGRLEFLGEKRGIAFYDDANATTPEAATAALEALAPQSRPIVLIAGGSDKELDYTAFAPLAAARAKHIILFKGAATDKLLPLLGDPARNPVAPGAAAPEAVSNMPEAFSRAVAAAAPGDIILLSPAATSFGIFKNEYDRGDQFREEFQKLK